MLDSRARAPETHTQTKTDFSAWKFWTCVTLIDCIGHFYLGIKIKFMNRRDIEMSSIHSLTMVNYKLRVQITAGFKKHSKYNTIVTLHILKKYDCQNILTISEYGWNNYKQCLLCSRLLPTSVAARPNLATKAEIHTCFLLVYENKTYYITDTEKYKTWITCTNPPELSAFSACLKHTCYVL